jgi:hypothetical protein
MKLNRQVLTIHKQISPLSCIPMSVEFVLKLMGRVPLDYFELQKNWEVHSDDNFDKFNGKTIAGLQFKRMFSLSHNDNFPFNELFTAIEEELRNERYVIISLSVPEGWHNYVIYDQLPNGEFRAVTKGRVPDQIENVRKIVCEMKGTDILTYVLR